MTYRIWITLFMFWFCAIPHLGSAQETGQIEGRVVNAAKQPIPGVDVEIVAPHPPLKTTTNANGRYRFDGLLPGQYSITAAHSGYKTGIYRQVQILDQETVVLDFLLVPAPVLQDKIVVSASRKEEKLLDAPASVVVVSKEDLVHENNQTVIEHMKHQPSVDYVQTGLTQTNVVARGFNNVASGALLSFVDNRISRLPSLRFNTHNFIPLTVDDIDRIELVLGPASALYGPESASGVLHIITRSPFDSEGTMLHSGGGERNMRTFYARHAKVLNDKMAYKLSAGHYFARDWKYEDAEEIRLRGFNPRNENIERTTGDLRLDLKPMKDLSLIFSAGYTKASHIEMTTVGAAQAQNWTYQYLQTRLRYRDLFAQAYYNRSNSGNTQLLRNGDAVVDKSTLTVFQIQHALSAHDRLRLTYGLDALTTIPKTEGTISGVNEEHDKIQIIGFYLQNELLLSPHWDLVLAGRYDHHNRITDPVLSPRAALVFKPTPDQTVRFTFNRAFGTPTSTNLFLDILSSRNPFGVGIDLRAQGAYQGFTFQRDDQQNPMFRSPLSSRALLDITTYIPLHDPQFTNLMWQNGRDRILAQFLPTFRQLAALDHTPQDVEALVAQLPSILPQALAGLQNDLRRFNPVNGKFVSTSGDSLIDIPRLKPDITQTLELGYKAVIGNKLMLTADVYRNQKTNFVGQFEIETPNVFLNATTLSTALSQRLSQSFATASDDLRAILQKLDAPINGGNGNGTPEDELVRLFVFGKNGQGITSIPFGTVSPEQATDPTAVILSYRNQGRVTVYGIDLSFIYYASDAWSVAFNYSHLSETWFPTRALNAPSDKFNLGSRYHHAKTGLGASGWIRHRGSFLMESGVYAGPVAGYTLFDLDVSYDLPIHSSDASAVLILNINNLFDRKHQEFIGAPEIGRFISGGLTVRF